jgi:hypothetical protein
MRSGQSRIHLRTTRRCATTLAMALGLAGAGCGLGTAKDSKSENGTEAAAGAAGSSASAQAGGTSLAGDAGSVNAAGGVFQDNPNAGAGRTTDDTSKPDAGASNFHEGVGGETSHDDGADATSRPENHDDSLVGGAGGSTSDGNAGGDSSAVSAGGDSAGHDGGDEQPTEPTLCQLGDGEATPYDYTYGLVQEYALDVSMDCEVGGQLMPLVMEDPDQLSAVLSFESEVVDWYRVRVLECPDETSSWSADRFGLLPPNDAGFSRGDVAAAIDLFMAVLDRHDGSDDGLTADQKKDVRARLEKIGEAAAVDSDEVTMPLDVPECASEGSV